MAGLTVLGVVALSLTGDEQVMCLTRKEGKVRWIHQMPAFTDPDRKAAKRAFDAMMTMRKIDIAKIEAARKG